MELRKVEQELENLSAEWKALRRKRPKYAGTTDATTHDGEGDDESFPLLSDRMPSWKELQSRVKDDEIFPPEEEEEDGVGDDNDDVTMENDIANSNTNNNGHGANATTGNNNDPTGDNADAAAGYSEFGMCIAPSNDDNVKESTKSEGTTTTSTTSAGKKNGKSVWERYAAKSTAAAAGAKTSKIASEPVNKAKAKEVKSQLPVDDEEERETKLEDAPAKELLAGLESLQERFKALEPKIEKFLMKLKDRDPVTKKPRYGEKTMFRVKNAVRTYKTLEQGMNIAFLDTDTSDRPSVISSLRSQIQQHTQNLHAQTQAKQSHQQLKAQRLAMQKSLDEERANQQRLTEEQKRRSEEKELARRAEEARLHRLEEERRAVEDEQRADRELLALVPTLGSEGVREQIGRMREDLMAKDDRAALDVALGSLYTLFEQIVRKPEEINFRRVRRDHPKFMEDIGRHVGGREVLIAAGFKLKKLDGVPCFYSHEPHIETNMDGWSDWFDTLKKTLEIVEEEMLK